ncbi:hypothetical protein [Winogradskyella sp.]|uniref:hypothetical protein n=1 Tax=Winogradskyella sp. TaxID=1883156 RepID=UPI003BAB2AE6
MKLNHKIKIDLFEVFKSGKFDFIRIGKDKNWILKNFPEPDEYEAGKTLESSRVWRYGNIEFHFENNLLTQIFTDYIDSLDGGENIELGKWIFKEPEKLTAEYVIRHLTECRIDFWAKSKMTEFICQTSIWLTNSNVYLNFQPIQKEDIDFDEWYNKIMKSINPNEYKLCSFTIAEGDRIKTAYNDI